MVRPTTGLYRTTSWWNSANAITVLVDYARVSHSAQYDSVFADTFAQAQKTRPGFLNNFYDDEGWWALAWIDAYDLTHDKHSLLLAESIFTDMADAWNDTCQGGIWWSKDKNYKNAIANELFLSLAAHLVNRTSGSDRRRYLEWSNKKWNWFHASGMINEDHLINVGLMKQEGLTGKSTCINDGKTTWTYNQGVILGGFAEFSVANHNPGIRQAAQSIATAAITHLVDQQGIVHDPCEPKCGADGVQFKGVLVRNLVLLDHNATQASYLLFVDNNASALWSKAQGSNTEFGERWSGLFSSSDAASQIRRSTPL